MNHTISHPHEKTAQLLWSAFILMFFGIQATIWVVAISITSQDSSHAVVAGYDEQALTWDDIKKARQESAELGWSSQIWIDDESDIRGYRNLTLKVNDRAKQQISNAVLQLRAFHRGAAAEPQDLDFVETQPGTYTSRLRVTRFGTWCFTGSVIQNDSQFFIDQTLQISKADASK